MSVQALGQHGSNDLFVWEHRSAPIVGKRTEVRICGVVCTQLSVQRYAAGGFVGAEECEEKYAEVGIKVRRCRGSGR